MAPTPDTAPGFIHNLETCVGCHACVIACANENGLEPGRFWRQIVTHNPSRQPDLPVYHLSLACNHCLDAPCVDGCPAVAIERHPKTGAVLIDDAKCIGCQSCSWVCPYDAPRFNATEGIMTKCTLCNHRLLEGLQPACTSQCPTGALAFGHPTSVQSVDVHGFPEFDVRPSIAFLPMTGRHPQPAPPTSGLPAEEQANAWARLEEQALPDSKTTLRNEWPLAFFTFVAIALVGWVLATGLGEVNVEPTSFLAAGAAGMALSTLHLRRKARAWRAILNWRRSWLSREVLAYPAFLALVAAWMLFDPANDLLRVLAAVTGVLLLFTIDGVYNAMARAWRSAWDARSALLSALFLGSVVGGNVWAVLLFGILRFLGFIDRMKRQFHERRTGREFFWILGRVVVGFVLPLVLWGTDDLPSLAAIVSALAGELIDRLHFYVSLDIVTPRRTMATAQRNEAGHEDPRS
jgi:Fe-S-cluster-containing dehydrogenase component/DMSO reductase anchor subunit